MLSYLIGKSVPCRLLSLSIYVIRESSSSQWWLYILKVATLISHNLDKEYGNILLVHNTQGFAFSSLISTVMQNCRNNSIQLFKN